jgi:hypothetical protein
MTINTQNLRRIGALLDEGYQINDHSGVVTQAADIIDALEGQVAEYARIAEKTAAEAGARIDAQAAEIARLREALRPLAEIDLTEPPPNDFAWFVLRARAALSGESNGG